MENRAPEAEIDHLGSFREAKWPGRGPDPRLKSRNPLYFHDLEAVSRKINVPGIDARKIFSDGHFVEGAPASPKVEFRPVCLGFEPFLTSAGDRAFSREFGKFAECHPSKTLCWRGCEGDPFATVSAMVDRAFSRGSSGATIFPLGGFLKCVEVNDLAGF